MPDSLQITSPKVSVLRQRAARALGWATIGSYTVYNVALGAGGTMGPFAAGMMAVFWCMLIVWLLVRWRKTVPGTLRIDDTGLHVERQMQARGGRVGVNRDFALREIESAHFVPKREGDAAVDITMRDGTNVRASVGSEATARAALERLGMDPASHRAEVALRMPGIGFGVAILATFVLMIASMTFIGVGAHLASAPRELGTSLGVAAFWASIMGGALTGRSLAGRFSIGIDGVYVRAGRMHRFVSYDRLEQVEAVPGAIEVRIRGGETLKIRANRNSPEEIGAVVQRIRDAMDARLRVGDSGAREFSLARGDRDFGKWLSDLKTLFDEKRGYRSRDLDVQTVASVLANADAPIDERIASVVALKARGSPELDEKVRVAIATTASEPVRVALTRAAEGKLDEGDVEAAVESVDAKA